MEEERIDATREFPIFRDIRRYTCEYCGIVRSKKTIITAHIHSHHQDEIKDKEGNEEDEQKGGKMNVCEECGASFQKPAHLKQHMQSHSFERPFLCPIKDCNSSYRRKDHLNRHLIQHEGKIFNCPIENCKSKFSIQGNMTRHVREMHDESDETNEPKQYPCLEPGCGKVFKYASKLKTHEESHVRLETVEAFCGEAGCMKYFTNEKCLKAHIQTCHQHVKCEICGSKQLKKNIKRHLRTHENRVASKERIKCSFDGCNLTFSTSSNLKQHIKAVHCEEKPFVCSISGCGMRFSFKHVRDNHEKSGCHVYTTGDFVESDEQFQSRARGGVKRKLPGVIDGLMRKRILPPTESDELQGSDYISWLLSSATDDED